MWVERHRVRQLRLVWLVATLAAVSALGMIGAAGARADTTLAKHRRTAHVAAGSCPTKLVKGNRQALWSSPEGSGTVVGTAVPILVAVGPATKPHVSSLPAITGTRIIGSKLTVAPGKWSGAGPFTFTYSWVRCLAECTPIRGADGSTYTVTKADAVTTDAGLSTTLFAVVLAKDVNGGVTNVASCGVLVPGPRQRPRNTISALADASLIIGPAGELPQLRAHDGYTASYFALRRGRVTITWSMSDSGVGPVFAHGSAVFRHVGQRGRFKVTLTPGGRRLLKRHRSVTVESDAEWRPLHGMGGGGVITPLKLTTATPAREL